MDIPKTTRDKDGNLVIEIDPAIWDRGAQNERRPTCLYQYREVGPVYKEQACCMGFAALALGATIAEIEGHGRWGDCGNDKLVERDCPDDQCGDESEPFAFDGVYLLNDAPDTPDDKRVEQINKALEDLREDFRFVLKGGSNG